MGRLPQHRNEASRLRIHVRLCVSPLRTRAGAEECRLWAHYRSISQPAPAGLRRTQRTFLTEVNGVPTVLVEGRGEGRCYCKVDPHQSRFHSI